MVAKSRKELGVFSPHQYNHSLESHLKNVHFLSGFSSRLSPRSAVRAVLGVLVSRYQNSSTNRIPGAALTIDTSPLAPKGWNSFKLWILKESLQPWRGSLERYRNKTWSFDDTSGDTRIDVLKNGKFFTHSLLEICIIAPKMHKCCSLHNFCLIGRIANPPVLSLCVHSWEMGKRMRMWLRSTFYLFPSLCKSLCVWHGVKNV